MGDKPIWEQTGSSFFQHYYKLFDNDRSQLGTMYIDVSCLVWEGQQFQGKAAIVEKLSSFPFQKIQHSPKAQDHQPTPDSCIIDMVVYQLKADEDPIIGLHQMFLLKNIDDAWVCTNDILGLPCTTSADLLPAKHSCCFLLPSSRYFSHFSRCSKYHTQMSRAMVETENRFFLRASINMALQHLAFSKVTCQDL